MNELTGAFLLAQKKGENLSFTRQSLANAGYPIQDIENAVMEANQILLGKKNEPTMELKPKNHKRWLIFIIILVVIICLGVGIFFFRENLANLFKNISGDLYV